MKYFYICDVNSQYKLELPQFVKTIEIDKTLNLEYNLKKISDELHGILEYTLISSDFDCYFCRIFSENEINRYDNVKITNIMINPLFNVFCAKGVSLKLYKSYNPDCKLDIKNIIFIDKYPYNIENVEKFFKKNTIFKYSIQHLKDIL